MKRILAVIMILMLSKGIYAQYGGALDNFDERPLYVHITEIINKDYGGYLPTGDKTFLAYLERGTFSFFDGGKLFVLSYEWDAVYDEVLKDNRLHFKFGEVKERSIYLFRLDGKRWVKASKPLKTDFYAMDINNIYSYDYYYPYKDGFGENPKNNGYIKKMANGYVEIQLTSLRISDVSDPRLMPIFYNEIFLLKSNDNETYSIVNEITKR